MMNDDERYRNWKRARVQVRVPADFTDRVMRAVAAHERRRPWSSSLAELLLRLIVSRPARVGICALAGLVCAVRMWSVLALFIAEISVAE
jgi:hypothetical protein